MDIHFTTDVFLLTQSSCKISNITRSFVETVLYFPLHFYFYAGSNKGKCARILKAMKNTSSDINSTIAFAIVPKLSNLLHLASYLARELHEAGYQRVTEYGCVRYCPQIVQSFVCLLVISLKPGSGTSRGRPSISVSWSTVLFRLIRTAPDFFFESQSEKSRIN